MGSEACRVAGDQNRVSFYRLLQLIVALAWIVAFWILLQGLWGTPLLGKFLRPDYWWLVEIGTAVLMFFVLSLVYCAPHNRGTRGLGLLLQMGIMILPLLYLPTAAVSKLSHEAVKKRSIYATQSRPAKDGASRSELSGLSLNEGRGGEKDFNLEENPSLLRLVFEPAPYEGRRVTTMGMVYWDDRLPENSFFCFQLLMFCCAADAKPIGVLVEYDKSNTLEKGSWVTVDGTVGFATLEDRRLTKISAEHVKPTEPPKDPYLLP
jgi:putative membrane protein